MNNSFPVSAKVFIKVSGLKPDKLSAFASIHANKKLLVSEWWELLEKHQSLPSKGPKRVSN